tara:strand:+ start:3706 stop:3990 length:285 start_codon:yes stop_codon:yes gene_type:complete
MVARSYHGERVRKRRLNAMADIPSLIVWAGISVVGAIGAFLLGSLNLKERISTVALLSGGAAVSMCGFNVGVTAGLGVTGGMLVLVALLLGYEG